MRYVTGPCDVGRVRRPLPVLPQRRLDVRTPSVAAAAATAALLGDPVRAGILAVLASGPHCVCEMAAALNERQNNVSNHLAKLRRAGLVQASRHVVDARWVYYERDATTCALALKSLEGLLR
jgi:ArsR family transcriptional regulator